MKAREIADGGIAALRSGKYRNVRLNFANPDMVAHTGDLEATIQACSVVDKCVKVTTTRSLRPQTQQPR
jgi:2,3-bisphosphoglycerate-independent phosphoglycerate mutase